MARLLAAGAANDETAADRCGDAMVTASLWLLGCLVAGVSAVGRGAEGFCSPSDYAGAFVTIPLGGWTPCVISLALTDVPCILIIGSVFVGFFWSGFRKGWGNVDVPRRPLPAGWERIFRWTLIIAFFAFAALRMAHMMGPLFYKESATTETWEYTDGLLFLCTWEVLVIGALGDDMFAKLRKLIPDMPLLPRPWFPRLLNGLAFLDIVKTLLIARMPWQPATEANKMLPVLGGWYIASIIVETYILMMVALHRLASDPAAAAEEAADAKVPLLTRDATAAGDAIASADEEAAVAAKAG